MTDSDGPKRGEMERLYRSMDEGFSGVHSRLDTLNGRTLKGEISDAELRVRVTSIEKEVFSRPQRRLEDREQVDERNGRLSVKDMAMGGLGLTLLAGAIKLLLVIGEFGLELLKASVKH